MKHNCIPCVARYNTLYLLSKVCALRGLSEGSLQTANISLNSMLIAFIVTSLIKSIVLNTSRLIKLQKSSATKVPRLLQQ